jgi:AcrR family transcriptional regulator
MSGKTAVTKASLVQDGRDGRESARARLLAAANELFYEEGVHTVGIDRVIERAGVAKATLYNTFGSKDELIRTYLQARHEVRRGRIEAKIAEFDDPRDKILAVYDLLGEIFAESTFRGCAFLNASAEARQPGSRVGEACDDARAYVRGLLTDLARQGGLANPEALGRQLVLLYDGAGVGAQMDRDPSVAAAARAAAAALIEAAAVRV